MSISDPLMLRYWELLTDVSTPEIERMKRGSGSGRSAPHGAEERDWLLRSWRIFTAKRRPGGARSTSRACTSGREMPEEMAEFDVRRGRHDPAWWICWLRRPGALQERSATLDEGGSGHAGRRQGAEVTASVPSDLLEFVLRCGKLRFCQNPDVRFEKEYRRGAGIRRERVDVH